MTWPKTYTPETAPNEVIALARKLVPQLLVGDHSAISILREQYDRVQISSVDLTGAGFFINYVVPDAARRTNPPDFQGGCASIKAEGLNVDAGCILFVRDGWLDLFEVYTYGDVWTENMNVMKIEDIFPLCPPMESTT